MWLLLCGIAFVTYWVYGLIRMKQIYNYWEERGVPSIRGLAAWKSGWSIILKKKTFNQFHKDMYDQFPDAPYYGFFESALPILAIKDLDLVERVIIKDFHHFTDRGFIDINENPNPLDVNLVNMTGNKWRAMRSKLSPLFTTGKLRHMVPQMKEISEGILKTLEKKKTEVDMRDLLQRFSLDVIGSCAFGLSVDTVNEEEESEFRKMGKRSSNVDFKALVRLILIRSFPKLSKKLGISQFESVVGKYFSDIIKETIAHRIETGKTRNDFVQLFVTLKQKGTIEFDGDDREDEYLKTDDIVSKSDKKIEHIDLTDEAITGQAFIFLIAGFEATAVSMLFICYELAMNPDIQARAREEVVKITKTRGGVLNYDTLRDMTYFGQCVKESMRLHTFAGNILRKCTKDYTFPGTSLSIKAGQSLVIPTIGIHMDPRIYEDPETFNPDRFAEDVSRKNCAYIPFGDGPRICIAMRFVMTEIKLCIARILLDYTISINPKTILPLEIDPAAGFDVPKNTILFDFKKVTEDVMEGS